jgi:hypothetical protein
MVKVMSDKYKVILHVRGYTITEHWFGWAPDFTPLDAPVYRVSSPGGTFGINAPDIDTAVEFAVGLVVKKSAETIHAAMAVTWKEVEANNALETVNITNDGGITYPNKSYGPWAEDLVKS